MYLTEPQIRATLKVVQALSAQGSRLAVCYHRPRLLLWFFGLYLRFLGEPLRSAQQPAHMAGILRSAGFNVLVDESVAETGARLQMTDRAGLRDSRHLRVVVAEKG